MGSALPILKLLPYELEVKNCTQISEIFVENSIYVFQEVMLRNLVWKETLCKIWRLCSGSLTRGIVLLKCAVFTLNSVHMEPMQPLPLYSRSLSSCLQATVGLHPGQGTSLFISAEAGEPGGHGSRGSNLGPPCCEVDSCQSQCGQSSTSQKGHTWQEQWTLGQARLFDWWSHNGSFNVTETLEQQQVTHLRGGKKSVMGKLVIH